MTAPFRWVCASALAMLVLVPVDTRGGCRRRATAPRTRREARQALVQPRSPPASIAITFDDLLLPSERDELFTRADLPPQLARLYGKRVRLVGYAMLLDSEPLVLRFILRRDEQLDPRGPNLFRDEVVVKIRPENPATYSHGPFTVTGTLSIRDFTNANGEPISVFCLEDATTTDIQPKRIRPE